MKLCVPLASVVVLLLSTLHKGESFCFEQNVQIETTRFGRVITFCEFRGLKLLSGSNLFTQDCFTCNCTTVSLRCCGFGVNGGTYASPPNCKMVRDGCSPFYVRRENENLDCHTGNPILLQDSTQQKQP